MKNFRTTIELDIAKLELNYSDRFFSMGSCFAEEMGQRLLDRKFNFCQNPFGILYNPMSIANAVNRLIRGDKYKASELQKSDSYFFSYDHHGRFSRESEEETLTEINSEFEAATRALKQASVIIFTFGTAHAFTELKSGEIVANCHKQLPSNFSHKRLKLAEIVQEWQETIEALRNFNPSCKIIFTVSPVRYFNLGARENQLSKATLHLAIDELCQDENSYYFPAYELQNDDLRDYRFYAEDMKHPSAEAIDYIFTLFFERLFDKSAKGLAQKLLKLLRQFKHRPRQKKSEEFAKFIENLSSELKKINLEHPEIDFSSEITQLKNWQP